MPDGQRPRARLENDAALCAQLGGRGRDYAARHFTFARVAAAYEDAVKETAGQG